MVKPLHAGLAARNGVLAALLAARGLQASEQAIDGRQGFLKAMDSQHASLDQRVADLGERWEIVDTGITVKLYPSCAGTHPTLDALLDLRRRGGFAAADVERVDVTVDSITPTVLIYDRPASGLEAKFSMPFCAAAAIVDGQVTIDTFTEGKLADPAIAALRSRVRMHVDPSLDKTAPPLTRARVRLQLADGRALEASANGARGYPERPPSTAERATKFRACAARVLPPDGVERALAVALDIERSADVRDLMQALSVA
jgi:2-methylcitrate dehydratase PrpD